MNKKKYKNLIFLSLVSIFSFALFFFHLTPSYADRDQSLQEPSQKDKDRMIKCHQVAELYHPDDDGNLVKKHREDYIVSCFKRVEKFSEKIIKQIKDTIVLLKITDDVYCNAGLINSDTLVTARHCFAEKQDQGIEQAVIDKVEVLGFRSNGEKWKIESLVIKDDPLSKISIEEREVRGDLDYIILKPKGLHSQNNVPIIKNSRRMPISKGQRLFIAFYDVKFYKNKGELKLLVDDMFSCQALIIKEGYFNHICQSLEGASGAPVWKYENNKLEKIVGINVGSGANISGNLNMNEAVTYLP